MPLDQPAHDVQPKSCAFTDGLRSKKRIEDTVANFDRNTMPVIDHTDRYMITLTSGDDFNLATLVHGIQRVIDQVRPDLIELASESMHRWKILLEVQTHSN